MPSDFDDLYSMIAKVIRIETKFNVPRIGQVADVNDELEKGRILVTIPVLGWNTPDTGAWCYPKDKKAVITPKVDDFVLVEFIDGKRDLPVYSSLANQMKDMLPKNFDGVPTTQILFEDNNQEFFVKYDEKEKVLYIEDSHGNKVTLDSEGILVEDTNGNKITKDSSGILLEDANGNDISMESGKVFINGNLEILQ